MKKIKALLVILVFMFSCSSPNVDVKELEKLNQRSDSISEQLNSLELKRVNQELVQDPNNSVLYSKRARAYLQLNQFNEALNDAKLSIKIDSTLANNYLTLVDVYFAMNNTRLAKENLLEMEKKFPDNEKAFLKLAELFFLVKQYQESITYINKSLKLDESQARAYHLKGNVYSESGDTAKAISSFQTAIEQDNLYADAYYDLGVIYASRKNPLAFDYYANTIRVNPNHNQAFYARAKLFQDLAQFDEAILEYKNLIKKNASCDQCYYNLGAIYLEAIKDYEKAIEQFSKAIELRPNYIEAYFARGFSYYQLKNKASAKADYKMCLQLEPNYELAIQGLNELN